MTNSRNSILGHKHLNGWRLWGLVTGLISVSAIIPLSQIDTTNPAHISGMIQQTVRLAVPWLFVAFAASSLVYVFPNKFSKWIARNRRIFGLCFAAGMAWQLFFILWLVIGSFEYYMAEAYSYYDLSEQIPGYIILFAMTFTSFKFGRSMLSPRQWKFLHKGGIYFIWAVVWSTYWFELYFYDDIQPIDYAYYWMGIAAWGMRLAGWTKKRRLSKKMKGTLKLSDQIAFGIFTGIGLFLIFFGNFWTPLTPDTFSGFTFGGWAALFVPFLILVPLYTAALVATPARG